MVVLPSRRAVFGQRADLIQPAMSSSLAQIYIIVCQKLGSHFPQDVMFWTRKS